MAVERHYRKPGPIHRHVLNPAIRALTRAGLSVWGSRVLEVPGRRTGRTQRVPVNVLDLDGHQ
ncbi:MAG TPA: deazaflavin-dependent nitroreductase, partial [Acidimicrobiales bacterium]